MNGTWIAFLCSCTQRKVGTCSSSYRDPLQDVAAAAAYHENGCLLQERSNLLLPRTRTYVTACNLSGSISLVA